MRRYGIHFWKQLPFLRLLIALCAGILAERHALLSLNCIAGLALAALATLLFSLLFRYTFPMRLRWINGILISILFAGLGAIVINRSDGRNKAACIIHTLEKNYPVLAHITEPFSEKPASYKTIAQAEAIWTENGWQAARGNIIIYHEKEKMPALVYGDQILIRKPLQPIRNSGNPGGFDYRGWCVSQDIFCQLHLREKDYHITGKRSGSALNRNLFRIRDTVLAVIKRYIPGAKESGVAEALLIGYRNDLDKELVQSYSHTGVVHIIAISGLHLGMIYGLMLGFFRIFKAHRKVPWLKPLTILAVLWGFSLLTGAAASILRSAVMFSFIVIGESIGRKTQVFNTMAASAFCLLVYNPWLLWDVGFQLSYTAVLGIVCFMKPVYRLVYCRNKLLDAVWQLNAVSLSAQVFTLPLVLFYFHQFPNLFLFTNFIAVPLSGLILYGELVLMVISALPAAGIVTGRLLSLMLWFMNDVIEKTDRLPFAVTEPVSVNLAQCLLLYAVISFGAAWLLLKKTGYLPYALAAFLAVAAAGTVTQINTRQQHKLIVYNIPKRRAIDIVDGTHFISLHTIPAGEWAEAWSFHLRPARIIAGISAGGPQHIIVKNGLVRSANRKIVLIAGGRQWPVMDKKIAVDMIILSGSPRIRLGELAAVFNCPLYVFDSSNPLWKIGRWKKEADSLHLRHHSVPEKGALTMDL